jgi:hypothetical protein
LAEAAIRGEHYTHMPVRGALATAVALVALLVSGRAHAWQEAHQIGDDVHVRVDAAGMAQVEHQIRWHVVRGPLKSIDLVSIDPGVALEPDVPIAAEDGRALLAHAARHDDRTVRITIDEPRALMRGNFTFDVRWRTDLVAARAISRDGATWRLAWPSPVATDGIDAARTILDFPSAPDAPQPIVADTGTVDDGAIATVRREPGRDVLELVRPHVARGEAPVWTVRFDPRALAQVVDPRLRPRSDTAVPAEPDRVREASLAVGLAAIALLFGFLVLRRTRAFAAACAARGATARGLLPLSDRVRAALAGAAMSGALALELAGHPTWAALCIAIATLAAAARSPAIRAAARGPGRWLALRPEDAFATPPAAWTSDALAGLVLALTVGSLGLLLRRFDAAAPWLVALDGVAVLPLLVTGRASQLPPDGARTAAPWLARAFRALRAVRELRVSPWARVPLESETPDELRLLVLPRAGMPGVLGIELGLAWSATPVGWAASPELLARVLEGSAAAAKLARDLPASRALPGRRPDERVVRLLPRAPTRASAVALARELAACLTDRRVTIGPWKGTERRLPPVERDNPAARAA